MTVAPSRKRDNRGESPRRRSRTAPGARWARVLFCAAVGWLVLAAAPPVASGQVSQGAATEFQMTLTEVALCKSSACSDPHVMGSQEGSFDIASGGVGQAVGVYGNTFGIPADTYTHVRIKMGRTFTVTGEVDMGGGTTCYTFSATPTPGSISSASVGSTTGPGSSQTLFLPNVGIFSGEPTAARYSAAGVSLLDDSTAAAVVTLAQPFTRNAGEPPPTVSIEVGTSQALGAAQVGGVCVMLVQPPDVSIQIQ